MLRKHRISLALGAIAIALAATLTTYFQLNKDDAWRKPSETFAKYLVRCGVFKTTHCDLQDYLYATYRTTPADGSLELRYWNDVTGETRILSVGELKAIMKKMLSADAVADLVGYNADMDLEDRLIQGNHLSRVRMLSIIISDRPRDIIVQEMIKRYVHANRRDSHVDVLLVGDSIRMRRTGNGYGTIVYSRYKDRFNFQHIPHNTASTGTHLRFLPSWFSNSPGIVLLNAGLHDLYRVKDPNAQETRFSIPLDTYRDALAKIVKIVRKYNIPQFSFVMSTPVRDDVLLAGSDSPTRRNADVLKYNAIMHDVANEHDVEVIDLYSPIMDCISQCISERDGVHLTRRGSERAADIIGEAIDAMAKNLD